MATEEAIAEARRLILDGLTKHKYVTWRKIAELLGLCYPQTEDYIASVVSEVVQRNIIDRLKNGQDAEPIALELDRVGGPKSYAMHNDLPAKAEKAKIAEREKQARRAEMEIRKLASKERHRKGGSK